MTFQDTGSDFLEFHGSNWCFLPVESARRLSASKSMRWPATKVEITFLRQAAFLLKGVVYLPWNRIEIPRVFNMVSLNAARLLHILLTGTFLGSFGIQRTSQTDFEHLPINRLKNQQFSWEKSSDLDGLGRTWTIHWRWGYRMFRQICFKCSTMFKPSIMNQLGLKIEQPPRLMVNYDLPY